MDKGRTCRNLVDRTLDSLFALMERHATDGAIRVDQARILARSLLEPGRELARDIEAFDRAGLPVGSTPLAGQERRLDALARLVTAPVAHALRDDGEGLQRRHLPQFFAGLRMMMGDETHDALAKACSGLAERHRGPDGAIGWESFVRDRAAQEVQGRVRAAIAATFRRFDARKDWFLIRMNTAPSTVSLASNAFVARKPEDKPPQFTAEHMVLLFTALFEDVRGDGRFGQFLSDLDGLAGQLGV